MKEIRTAVIDTSVLVSILKGSSRLSPIYAAFKNGLFLLAISDELLRELRLVLPRSRLKIPPAEIKELFRLINFKARRVNPSLKPLGVCRDPKDEFLLSMAAQAEADFIVSSDDDLLVLKSFCNIPIITPREFIRIINKA